MMIFILALILIPATASPDFLTCGEVKKAYKSQNCCNNEDGAFVMQNFVSISHPYLGEVRGVCDKSGDTPVVQLEVDAAKWKSLGPPAGSFQFSVDLPAGCEPFKHIFVSYSVGGHPAWDWRQFNNEQPGGYGQEHVDVHFLTISNAERLEKTGAGRCVTNPNGPKDPDTGNPSQCDYSEADSSVLTQKFITPPPADYSTGFSIDLSFGGHAITGHGMHMISETDMVVDGPATCWNISNPSVKSWEGCAAQMMSVISSTNGMTDMTTLSFQDSNCKCGFWTDGITSILNTYNGKVIGNEVMPTVSQVQKLEDAVLANPYLEKYPEAAKYMTAGYQPTYTRSLLENDIYKVGLVLRKEWTAATPVEV